MGSPNGASHTESNVPALTAAPQVQTRPLYLLIFSGAVFHAHWSFYLPRLDRADIRNGKRSQVEGDPRGGFWLELVRGCNLDVDSPRPVHIVEIGRLRVEDVDDAPEASEWTVDTQPVDAFEKTCCDVPPPSPSLKASDTTADTQGRKPRRIEIRDCQWWATRVVKKLVEDGMLLPPTGGGYEGQLPTIIMERVPKHA